MQLWPANKIYKIVGRPLKKVSRTLFYGMQVPHRYHTVTTSKVKHVFVHILMFPVCICYVKLQHADHNCLTDKGPMLQFALVVFPEARPTDHRHRSMKEAWSKLAVNNSPEDIRSAKSDMCGHDSSYSHDKCTQ